MLKKVGMGSVVVMSIFRDFETQGQVPERTVDAGSPSFKVISWVPRVYSRRQQENMAVMFGA